MNKIKPVCDRVSSVLIHHILTKLFRSGGLEVPDILAEGDENDIRRTLIQVFFNPFRQMSKFYTSFIGYFTYFSLLKFKNIEWSMDRDRKLTGLKALQGHMWVQGYQNGQLKGPIYADVVPSLQRWQELKVPVNIYSR
jgi:hypothetical protein